jgi:hypothetical protein
MLREATSNQIKPYLNGVSPTLLSAPQLDSNSVCLRQWRPRGGQVSTLSHRTTVPPCPSLFLPKRCKKNLHTLQVVPMVEAVLHLPKLRPIRTRPRSPRTPDEDSPRFSFIYPSSISSATSGSPGLCSSSPGSSGNGALRNGNSSSFRTLYSGFSPRTPYRASRREGRLYAGILTYSALLYFSLWMAYRSALALELAGSGELKVPTAVMVVTNTAAVLALDLFHFMSSRSPVRHPAQQAEAQEAAGDSAAGSHTISCRGYIAQQHGGPVPGPAGLRAPQHLVAPGMAAKEEGAAAVWLGISIR